MYELNADCKGAKLAQGKQKKLFSFKFSNEHEKDDLDMGASWVGGT